MTATQFCLIFAGIYMSRVTPDPVAFVIGIVFTVLAIVFYYASKQ